LDIWYDSLDGGSARRKASAYTQDNTTQKNADTHTNTHERARARLERPQTVRALDRAIIGTVVSLLSPEYLIKIH
jgi:hypothetical protein